VVLALLGATALVVSVAFGADAMDELLLGRPAASWWTPFVIGLGLGALPCLAWIAVTSADGSVSWRIGAQAEQWTAAELDALGPSWLVEHDVPFPERAFIANVDHVAVGPHGVLAVETKWTSHEVDLGAPALAPEVERSIRQARAGAGRVRGLIRRIDHGAEVIPVVVYWGPHVIAPASPFRRVDDVRIVAGGHGAEWRPRLSEARLDSDAIDKLATRVRDWRVTQESKTVGFAVGSRLRHAERLGWVSIGLALVMVGLLPLSRASGPVGEIIDTTFRVGGSALAFSVLLMPLVAALGSAVFVWLARQLDPELRWLPRLAPLGAWILGFAAVILATP
jgi:hypothetical protein